MIICIICLGIESNNMRQDDVVAGDPEESNGSSKTIYNFLSIGLALCSAALLSSRSFVIRTFRNNSGYAGFDQSLDAKLLEGIMQCLFMILLIRHPDFTLTWFDFGRGALAGACWALGRILLAIAIAEGIAGPAQALTADGLWLTLWIRLFGT